MNMKSSEESSLTTDPVYRALKPMLDDLTQKIEILKGEVATLQSSAS
jgi:hypothetical protein